MMLKRNLLGWSFEEYWFDEAGYLASKADIVALRSHRAISVCDCFIPERTLLVPLNKPEADILEAFDARAKSSIRHAHKTVRIDLAITAEERNLFYAAYHPFAHEKGLLIPRVKEEAELEIILARNLEGELLQAGAFLPCQTAGLYRYRYGVYVRKSQANAALMQAAILRAKELGLDQFDLGGITVDAKVGSKDAGINFFKSQFGGVFTESHLYLRGTRITTRGLFKFLKITGIASRLHKLSAFAARWAKS